MSSCSVPALVTLLHQKTLILIPADDGHGYARDKISFVLLLTAFRDCQNALEVIQYVKRPRPAASGTHPNLFSIPAI